mmetsp:Transcript_25561/g.40962  ORF Transcript_25561/g.40962 Transcript_25561/m.40962 type:complete len:236 (+) Transcript_25561:83-790(+)|eukprot:CAMPEP_0169356448 /NCGR_PEP_ID=MMETSP1017-20121227/27545_1 /TAXON_ID=342587 /ORGANISM="Karlodinium micrum, Strain CCMP2283" /LENGTH=235 /DNA_ID=CAMNT_0009453231 /DNA_START=80 /DNA_END=787 /DNA_ORIENTATION=-
MLNSRTPEVCSIGKYMESFSDKRRQPAYSIGESERFNIKRSMSATGSLGPGQYRCDRDFPDEKSHGDMPTTFNTKVVQPSPKYSFFLEERIAIDGAVKGLSQFYMKKPNPLGPGQYTLPPVESRTHKRESVKYTIPKAKETQEAIREKKIFSTTPGPGIYDSLTTFDIIDRDRSQVIKRLARKVEKGRGCWAATQYANIFGAMTPKRGEPPNKGANKIAPTKHAVAPDPKDADGA